MMNKQVSITRTNWLKQIGMFEVKNIIIWHQKKWNIRMTITKVFSDLSDLLDLISCIDKSAVSL